MNLPLPRPLSSAPTRAARAPMPGLSWRALLALLALGAPRPVHAQSGGEAIDRIGWDEVVGTIAGENTIFLATHSDSAAGAVTDKIAAVCGEEE